MLDCRRYRPLMTVDTKIHKESWGNFPKGQSRLFNDLKEYNIRGVVLAGGDIHRSEFRKFERKGDYPLYELVASPLALTHANGCGDDKDGRRVGQCYAGGNSFISVEVNGAVNDPTLTAVIHGENGEQHVKLELKKSEL